jgi:hypothetical protein
MIILRSHDQRTPDYFLGVDRDWIECKDRQLWVEIDKVNIWVICIDETGLDILQLQNTTSSNQVKLHKKYVKSTLKFYYENLINNKLSKLDQKSKLYLFSN